MVIGSKNVKPAIITNRSTRTTGLAREPQKKKKLPTFINTAFTFENFVLNEFYLSQKQRRSVVGYRLCLYFQRLVMTRLLPVDWTYPQQNSQR
jgi:hypothetical protein